MRENEQYGKVKTVAVKWHEEAVKHEKRDGIAIGIALALFITAFITFGALVHTASAEVSEALEKGTSDISMEADDVKASDRLQDDLVSKAIEVGRTGYSKASSLVVKPQVSEEIREPEQYWEPVEDQYYGYEEAVYYEGGYSPGNAGTLMYDGVQSDGTHTYTWYSENVLPGYGLDIPGRHLSDEGYVCDGDGYVVVAADEGYLPYGSVIDTPYGEAKVYDSGCDYGVVDVYTGW